MTNKYNQLYSKEEIENSSSVEIIGNNFKSKIGKRYGFLTAVKIAGRTSDNKLSYFCLCDCGNYVLRQSCNLTNRYKHTSCGCKYSEAFRSNIKDMKENVLNNTDYEIVEAFPLWDSKWILNCKQHGLFTRRYASVKTGKYGCPNCTSFGFNPTKNTVFYVNSIWDNKQIVAYKFGLTNQNIKDRLRQYKLSDFLFVHNELELKLEGYLAWELERYIKTVIPCSYLDKKLMSNGFTETISPNNLVNLLNILNILYKDTQNEHNSQF